MQWFMHGMVDKVIVKVRPVKAYINLMLTPISFTSCSQERCQYK